MSKRYPMPLPFGWFGVAYADEINVGYEDLYSESVQSVNGKTPVDMADFVRMVEAAKDIVEIRTSSNGAIVFSPPEARAANTQIMARYHIPLDRSADLVSLGSRASGASRRSRRPQRRAI